jgi:aminoglycoside 2'-N-acetyltransferase I
MTSALRIEIIARKDLTAHQHAEISALCSRAYGEDFSSILPLFDQPTHILAYTNGDLVSHALWITRTLDYNATRLQSAYVEAVATEPAQQGRGYASALLRRLASAIATYDIGALSPSDPAFYSRLGWEVWRGPLYVATKAGNYPTPDEAVMILRLPRTPPLDLYGKLTAPWRAGDIW